LKSLPEQSNDGHPKLRRFDMFHKRFLFITLTLGAGAYLAGCAPASPPAGPGPGSFLPWNWFSGPTSFLLPLLLGVAVIAIALLFLRQGRASARPSARDIAQERYARGEITQQEYQALLRDLSEPAATRSPVQNQERA
jgi:hypothetical protein